MVKAYLRYVQERVFSGLSGAQANIKVVQLEYFGWRVLVCNEPEDLEVATIPLWDQSLTLLKHWVVAHMRMSDKSKSSFLLHTSY